MTRRDDYRDGARRDRAGNQGWPWVIGGLTLAAISGLGPSLKVGGPPLMARIGTSTSAAREHAPPLVEDRVEERVVVAQAPAPPIVHQSTDIAMPRDRIRWGPIWGGLIATLAIFLLLEPILYGFGWLTLDFTGQADEHRGALGDGVHRAGRLLYRRLGGPGDLVGAGRGGRALNGFPVWALATVLILVFSALGLGWPSARSGRCSTISTWWAATPRSGRRPSSSPTPSGTRRCGARSSCSSRRRRRRPGLAGRQRAR